MKHDIPHPRTSLTQCRIISLSSHTDENGTFTLAQNDNNIPFAIKRVFFTYQIPAGAYRGGHSHYREEQLIVAAAGSFDVDITDGTTRVRYTLNNPREGLYVPPGIWRSLSNFSDGSIVLAMSSIDFDEADYVRDYRNFLKLRGCK